MDFLLFAQAGDTFSDGLALFALLKQYGPLVLVMAFLLWQGWVREGRMGKRIVRLEDEQRNVLMPLVERCAGRDCPEHPDDGAVGEGPGRTFRLPVATDLRRQAYARLTP